MATELREGEHLTISKVVEDADLAATISADPEDAFPRVFATSRMVAMMELAAARLMKPLLGSGEMSVGVTVDIAHEAATPPGATVRATARFTGREGKLFVFEVTAEDPAGIVGRGTHKRAIVATERIVAGAERRRTAAGT
jgi:predicted thioesterase